MTDLRVGDRVEVTMGASRGICGEIVSIDHAIGTVTIQSDEGRLLVGPPAFLRRLPIALSI